MMKPGQTLGLHADYIGSHTYVENRLPVHGLNVHATRVGAHVARLGILRSLEDDAVLNGIRQESARTGAKYLELAAPFTRTPVIHAGDVLFFQAEQYSPKDMPATAHDFQTVSDRLSDVFRPHLGDETVVGEQRSQLAATYRLDVLGYS
jgi:hypothetical protein